MRKLLLLPCLLFVISPFLLNAQNQPSAEFYWNLVKNNAAAAGLSEADLKNVRISDAYYDEHSKVYMVYLQQTYKSVDVENMISPLAFKNNNFLTGKFLKNTAIETSAKNAVVKNVLIARDALIKAATSVNIVYSNKFSLPLKQSVDAKHFEFEKFEGLFNNVTVDLKWVSVDDNMQNFKLSWNVFLHTEKNNAAWIISVDALSGQVLKQKNLTVYESANEIVRPHHMYVYEDDQAEETASENRVDDIASISSANYKVIPYPVESPVWHAGVPTIVSNPWTVFPNQKATTLKWNSDGTTDYANSTGNNVLTSEDLRNKNNELGTEAVSSTATPNLNFEEGPNYNKAAISDSNQQFSLTNLFYWSNMVHDMTYQYGFDEVSGNFQTNNLSRGGKAKDEVYADGEDGYSMDNSNFSTPADGFHPRMQMFLWSRPPFFQTLYGNSPAGYVGLVPAKTSVISIKGEKAPITSDVVYYKNNTSGHNACVAPSNANELNGKIAYVDRGSCNFDVKVKNAQNAGAIAVIVGDTIPLAQSALVTMTNDTRSDGSYIFDTTVTIPSVFITRGEADRIKNFLTANEKVNVTLTSMNIDGSLDNGVIVHEYTHGISNRLTGGPSNVSCLTNKEQGGEGISDYNALMMTTDWTKAHITDGNKPRAIGNYVIGLDSAGSGIRTFPYSTDISINPWTYDSLPAIPLFQASPEPHYVGEIWCEMLWEMTWGIIQQTGSINQNFANANGNGGNSIAMNLFIEGLKLQPCNPTFLEARNAILQADTMLYQGKYSPAIWRAFAKRGLGYSADQGSRNNVNDNIPAYDLPPIILPVTFGTFTAQKLNNTSLLKWTTEQESNTDKFIVERSGDGKTYTSVGEVKATGASTLEIAYQFTDQHPLNGNNIYRIKEVDNEGRFNLSDLRSLNFADLKPYIQISPNPATNIVTIKIPGNTQHLSVRLLSTGGQLILNKVLDEEMLALDVSKLAAGVYNITIDGKGYSAKYKLVIQ